jgi:large subunit ribosomal protein L35Ae
MIVQAPNVDSREKAKELIGKSVTWKSPAGKELKGKVTQEHGNSGALRVQFETGMPGQALSGKVSIE